MHHSFTIDAESRLAISRIRGEMTPEAVAQQYSDILTHPDWQSHFDHLVVFDHIDMSLITSEEMRRLSQLVGALDREFGRSANSRTALVLDKEGQTAIMTMYEVLAASEVVTEERVFQTEHEAMAWLRSPRAG